MKYIIDVPDSFVDITNGLHIPMDKQGTFRIDTGLKLTPYTEPDEIKNNKVNLCTSCELYKEHFPECGDVNVLFGDGVVNDNICCCSGYVAKNEDKIRRKVEQEVWEFAKKVRLEGFDSYSEAKAKYEEWQKQKDEIHEYDEIISEVPDKKAVIVHIDCWGQWHCVKSNGIFMVEINQQGYWRKTGRSFPELGDVLKKMRED